MDEFDLAILLSYAQTFGHKAAAERFDVNVRTIQRHLRVLKDGKRPSLAKLVAQESQRVRNRNRDKLHQALDALLDRVIVLAPDATMGDVTSAIDKVGGLVVSKEIMGGDTDNSVPHAGERGATEETQGPSGDNASIKGPLRVVAGL